MDLMPPLPIDTATAAASSEQPERLLAKLENEAVDPADARQMAKLWDVAEGFEEMFLRLMLGTMRKTTMNSDLLGNDSAMEVYRGMQDEYLAETLAKRRDFGLSKMIVDWMVQRQAASGTSKANAVQAAGAYQAAAGPAAVGHSEIFADGQ